MRRANVNERLDYARDYHLLRLRFSASVAATVAVRSSLSNLVAVFVGIAPFVVVLVLTVAVSSSGGALIFLPFLVLPISLFLLFPTVSPLITSLCSAALGIAAYRGNDPSAFSVLSVVVVVPVRYYLARVASHRFSLLSYKFRGALLIQHVTKIESVFP